jgi:D-apionolactonase
MRQNPYGSATKANPSLGRMPMANRDPRHNALFAAAWAVGYAARCLTAQPEMLTLSALAGDFGLIAGAGEPSPPGGMRPLFHVVKALSELAGSGWAECIVSPPDQIAAIATADIAGERRVIIANLTPEPRVVDLSGLVLSEAATAALLDERCMALASNGVLASAGVTCGSLLLNAFALAFIRQPSFASPWA